MMSKASTVEAYLAELPKDRREAIAAVRQVILDNLDQDFEEGMQYGMIAYYVPHRVYPAGYHCDPKQPLCYAGLASQKNHMALYLMPVYGDDDHARWFRKAWTDSGKKLDMGKACIRFKKLDDVPLPVVGAAVGRISAKKWIEIYETSRNQRPSAKRESGEPAKKRKPAKNNRKVKPREG